MKPLKPLQAVRTIWRIKKRPVYLIRRKEDKAILGKRDLGFHGEVYIESHNVESVKIYNYKGGLWMECIVDLEKYPIPFYSVFLSKRAARRFIRANHLFRKIQGKEKSLYDI